MESAQRGACFDKKAACFDNVVCQFEEEPYLWERRNRLDSQTSDDTSLPRKDDSLRLPFDREPYLPERTDNLGFEHNEESFPSRKQDSLHAHGDSRAIGGAGLAAPNKTHDQTNNKKNNVNHDSSFLQYPIQKILNAGNRALSAGLRTKGADGGKVSDRVDFKDEAKAENPIAYKRRWYILLVYSLIAFTQGCVWNAFGPISFTSQYVFHWTNGDIALINNWVFISYFIGGVFFSWMLDVKGLRWACLTSTFLMACGSAFRCITTKTPAITWLVNFGHLLNGLAGPVAMGAPPFVSAVWFPLEERATATAMSTTSNFLGVAMAFVLGPNIVHQISSQNSAFRNTPLPSGTSEGFAKHVTTAQHLLQSSSAVPASATYTDSDLSQIADVKNSIQRYMIIEAGWCAGLFLLVLIYFPARPPTPPCASAGVQRESFCRGLKDLLRKKQFLLVTLVVLAVGVVFSWSGMIYLSLSFYDIEEKEAGWIGFYGIIASSIASLIIARFADRFARFMKWCVMGQLAVGSFHFFIFALASTKVITPSVGLFYATIIIALMSINSALPLLFEIGCEQAYPIGEGTTTVVILLLSSLGGFLFLLVGMIPNIGTLWMSWTLFGVTALCMPVLFTMKVSFKRRQIDEPYPHPSDINMETTRETNSHRL